MKAADEELISEGFFQASGLAADFAAQARLGIYVHVPFCPHICPYCDFVKTSRFTRADVQSYFAGLEEQYELLMKEIPSEIQTVTLYLGGGTPSLFSPDMYQSLVKKISSRFLIEEFTIESNPFTNAEKNFRQWVDLGVNHMTLGAQSLHPEVLKYLGRKHSPELILKNIELAKLAGIESIQVDLIFGVRELATERELSSEIRALAHSGATGVSCYLLTIEDSTSFVDEKTADDSRICDEYKSICETATDLGFAHHETSNFGKNPSIHNRLYWYGLPYLGLGTGAHGLMPANSERPLGLRYKVGVLHRREDPGNDKLMFASEKDRLFKIEYDAESRTRDHVLQEMLFTLLRTEKGIPKNWLSSVYSEDTLDRLFSDARWRRAYTEGVFKVSQTHIQLAELEKLRGDSWSLLLNSILHPEVTRARH